MLCFTIWQIDLELIVWVSIFRNLDSVKKPVLTLGRKDREYYPPGNGKKNRFGQIWYPGETLIAGIGQGYFIATPIQLAQSMAILANPDAYKKPHLLYARQPNPAKIPERYLSKSSSKLVLQETHNREHIIKSMIKVTGGRHGTALNAFKGTPYEVAGKTGTAQVFTVAQDAEYDKELIEKRLQDHALFTGFAPSENPEIAIAVIIENGGSGGSVAAPIARKVLDAWLLQASH